MRIIADDAGNQLLFEEAINSQLNGLISNLRRNFQSSSKLDFRLMSYRDAGFSIMIIACVRNLATESVYVKKSRLVKSIEESGIIYRYGNVILEVMEGLSA